MRLLDFLTESRSPTATKSKSSFLIHDLSESSESRLMEVDLSDLGREAELLDAPIMCGFELEFYWTLLAGNGPAISRQNWENFLEQFEDLEPEDADFDSEPFGVFFRNTSATFPPELQQQFLKKFQELYDQWRVTKDQKITDEAFWHQIERMFDDLLITDKSAKLLIQYADQFMDLESAPRQLKALPRKSEDFHHEAIYYLTTPYAHEFVRTARYRDWLEKNLTSLFTKRGAKRFAKSLKQAITLRSGLVEFVTTSSVADDLEQYLTQDLGVTFTGEDAWADGPKQKRELLRQLNLIAPVFTEQWLKPHSTNKKLSVGLYHHTKKNQTWRLETDGSLRSGLRSGEVPVELISPAFPTVREAMENLESLLKYLESAQVRTSPLTGLHMTFSYTGARRPYNRVKMVLLLNDQYWLTKFSRLDNEYSQSQIALITENLPLDLIQLTDTDIKKVESLFEPLIATDKHYAIHFKKAANISKNKHVEFRIMGNQDYHQKFPLIRDLMLQYAAVMEAGYNPQAFKTEYEQEIKKLIKVVKSSIRRKGILRIAADLGSSLPQGGVRDTIYEYAKNYHDYFSEDILINFIESLFYAVERGMITAANFTQTHRDILIRELAKHRLSPKVALGIALENFLFRSQAKQTLAKNLILGLR